MAKRRYLNTAFWDDLYISELDPIEKLLYIYLLTNPCTNISGAYQIKINRAALDTGIDKDMVLKIFARFQNDEKIFYDNGWMVIRNFVKHQNIGSALVKKGIENELKNVPKYLHEYIYGLSEALKLGI